MTNRRTIGQNMLMAVNDFMQTDRSPKELTTEFWQALGPFASEFLAGQVNIEISGDGRVVASFHPEK